MNVGFWRRVTGFTLLGKILQMDDFRDLRGVRCEEGQKTQANFQNWKAYIFLTLNPCDDLIDGSTDQPFDRDVPQVDVLLFSSLDDVGGLNNQYEKWQYPW